MQHLNSYSEFREYFEKHKYKLVKKGMRHIFLELLRQKKERHFDFFIIDCFERLEEDVLSLPNFVGKKKFLASEAIAVAKKVDAVPLHFKKQNPEISISINDSIQTNVLHLVQAELVKIALQKMKGNRTLAAKYLGVSIRTMRNWINKEV